MPELPEVEVTRRALAPYVEQQTVESVIVREPRLRWPVPDEVRELAHTRCPACHAVLVERDNYETTRVHLAAGGRCPGCDAAVPGLWDDGTPTAGIVA